MMMYIYANHINGDLYVTEHELDYEEAFCPVCGDWETWIGDADSRDTAWEAINDSYCIDLYDKEYLQDFVEKNWSK